MKKITPLLIALSLVTANGAYANEVKSAGQAVGICKAEAEKQHADFKRAKPKKIKQTRGMFKIRLNVTTEGGKETVNCEVSKGGEVSYSKA